MPLEFIEILECLQTSREMDMLDTAAVKERNWGWGWTEGSAMQGSADAICFEQFPPGLMEPWAIVDQRWSW